MTQHWHWEVATSHPAPHPEIFSPRKHYKCLSQPFPKGSHAVLGEQSFSGLSTLPLPAGSQASGGIGRETVC